MKLPKMLLLRAAVAPCVDGFFQLSHGLQQYSPGKGADVFPTFFQRAAVGRAGPVFSIGTAFVIRAHGTHILPGCQCGDIQWYGGGKAH